jgi:phage terminase small subunit
MARATNNKQNAITIKKEIAINALIGGASVTTAAQEAGYSRETLSRLLHDNVVFQAELNRRRIEAQDITTGKLSGLI